MNNFAASIFNHGQDYNNISGLTSFLLSIYVILFLSYLSFSITLYHFRFMKNLILLLSICSISFSIGCKNQSTDNQSVASTPSSNPKMDTFAVLRGAWVNAKYLDALNKGVTLGKVQFDNTTEVTTLDIDSSNVQMGFNFHEGMGCVLHKLDEKFFSLYDTEGSGEKREDIEIINDHTIKVGKATLTKVGMGKRSEVILANTLVGGQYRLDQTTVQFKDDGTVTGLEPYTHYNILFDYNGEINPPNQIGLISKNDKTDYFAFEKQKTNLTLFDMRCVKKDGDICLKQVKGKVHWAFVGQ